MSIFGVWVSGLAGWGVGGARRCGWWRGFGIRDNPGAIYSSSARTVPITEGLGRLPIAVGYSLLISAGTFNVRVFGKCLSKTVLFPT